MSVYLVTYYRQDENGWVNLTHELVSPLAYCGLQYHEISSEIVAKTRNIIYKVHKITHSLSMILHTIFYIAQIKYQTKTVITNENEVSIPECIL